MTHVSSEAFLRYWFGRTREIREQFETMQEALWMALVPTLYEFDARTQCAGGVARFSCPWKGAGVPFLPTDGGTQ